MTPTSLPTQGNRPVFCLVGLPFQFRMRARGRRWDAVLGFSVSLGSNPVPGREIFSSSANNYSKQVRTTPPNTSPNTAPLFPNVKLRDFPVELVIRKVSTNPLFAQQDTIALPLEKSSFDVPPARSAPKAPPPPPNAALHHIAPQGQYEI
jgi:hypothetical protein